MRNLLQSLFGKKDDPDSALSTILAGSPFEVIMVPGIEAEATRERLRGYGTTPVILGSSEDADLLVESLADSGPDLADILAEAEALDLAGWLRSRRNEDRVPPDMAPSLWPVNAMAPQDLTLHYDVLAGRPKDRVLVALFGTPRGWEVPAHVRFGGWNTCPPAEVHVAMHRRWHQRWGADIACISGDVIECTVTRPPGDRAAARELAAEHMAYCPEIVLQGTQSLDGLATALVGARTWHFWWQ